MTLVLAVAGTLQAGEEPTLKARMSFPFDRALVRANVPVFGVAWAKEFDSYRLEFGEGREPKEWVLIHQSRQPRASDPFAEDRVVWSKDWGFPKGNLGTWETGLDEYAYGQKFKHNLRGEHTLRLTVRDQQGRTAQHAILVTVARALMNAHGGYGQSPDEVVRFDVPANSLDEAFKLVSILPTDQPPAPRRQVLLSKMYELRPPGLELIRPATLSFKFAPSDLDKKRVGRKPIAPGQVAIHAYDPVDQRWRPLPTKVDVEQATARTSVRLVTRYLAYYALLADVIRPPRPRLAKLPTRTHSRRLTVKGAGEPDSRAVVTCAAKSGIRRLSAPCDAAGAFAVEVLLREGANTLTAHCVEKARNQSALTRPHRIVLEYDHPRRVRDVKIVDAQEAAFGQKLCVKVAATGMQPGRNTTLVRIASTKTDPEGFTLEAVESGPRSEVYEAAFDVGGESDGGRARIGAKIDSEKNVATWPAREGDGSPREQKPLDVPAATARPDVKKGSGKTPVPLVTGEIVYRDRVPPSAPTVACTPCATLCWSSFEADDEAALKQWRPLDATAGAAVSIESEDGNRFVRLASHDQEAGHLGVTAWSGAYTVSAHPILCFDFRASPDTQVDLLVAVGQPPVGWRGIGLTDQSPYYARLGRIHGVKADGQWHHAQVDLLRLLRERFGSGQRDGSPVGPGTPDEPRPAPQSEDLGDSAKTPVPLSHATKTGDGSPGPKATLDPSDITVRVDAKTDPDQTPVPSDYVVTRVAFADWDGGERLFATKYHGRSASRGCRYDVDNFAIRQYAGSGESVTFTWAATDDSGLACWSYVLDRAPGTVPPERGVGTEAQKTYLGLADGRWWFHVRGRDVCGNWGPANHFLHVVDTEPPTAALDPVSDGFVPFGQGLAIQLSDAGSGADPGSVVLDVNGRRYRAGEPMLEYDASRGRLTWHPGRSKPYPRWFVHDAPISIKLLSLQDYAGRRAPQLPSWQLRAASPVRLVRQGVASRRGWCVEEPQLGLASGQQARWALAWMRTLQRDPYARAGCYIRELALLPKGEEPKDAKPADGIPVYTGKPEPHFVAEVQVDRTVPRTRLETVAIPGKEGQPDVRTVRLSHHEYAYRRGGLLGRYYRTPDFTDPICERVDASVYFSDGREQFTAPVPGAQSAVWRGGLYAREQQIVLLELALWQAAPASGRALIDGDVVLELRPEDMTVVGYKKERVLLTPGLHELRLEFREPEGRPWSFALLRWGTGPRGEATREPLGPRDLYYPQCVGTTRYRWNHGPWQHYRDELTAPTGRNVLTFHTVDDAGNAEPEQRREFGSTLNTHGRGGQGGP